MGTKRPRPADMAAYGEHDVGGRMAPTAKNLSGR